MALERLDLLLTAALCLLLAVPVVSGAPGLVRIASVEFGSLVGDQFLPRPSRVFGSGEAVVVKVTVSASSTSGGTLVVRGALVHPLGPVLSEASSQLEVPAGSSSWDVLFKFRVDQRLPSGYYRVFVKASLAGVEAGYEAAFLLLAPATLENRLELEYALEVSGAGFVKTLLLALPNDPTLEVIAGPIITPSPSSIVVDELGNRYALFEDLKVERTLRITVTLFALQRMRWVAVDAALGAPLPPEARRFLEPSPYIESNAPEIVSLAERLVSGATTYREALTRISDFVSTHLVYDESISELPNYRALGALWALHARKGACVQFARLYVALARAAGIPARVVEGFDAKPPAVSGERYAHAYVEVYVPGYGWLPVEPQYPGSTLGLTPPALGYIAVVRGSDSPVELAGERRGPSLFLLTYSGSLHATLSYTASMAPLQPQLKRFTVDAAVPSQALYGEVLLLKPEATVRGANCEVSIRSPASAYLLSLSCGRPIEVELNETGSWSIGIFAWAAGCEPFYGSWTIQVKPRPLNLTVRVVDAMLLRQAAIIVETVPPVSGARVLVEVEACDFAGRFTAETGPDGTAVLRVGPLLLPCVLKVAASTSPRGYEPAAAMVSLIVAPSPELIAAAALLTLLTVLLKRKHRAKAGEGFGGELPEPWV
ncbi:MAG: transglutaminase domain-containing protein [Thermofilaceae archaeon]